MRWWRHRAAAAAAVARSSDHVLMPPAQSLASGLRSSALPQQVLTEARPGKREAWAKACLGGDVVGSCRPASARARGLRTGEWRSDKAVGGRQRPDPAV